MCSENAVTTRPFNYDENIQNAFTISLLGENYSPEFRVELQSPLQIIRATIAANNPFLTFSEVHIPDLKLLVSPAMTHSAPKVIAMVHSAPEVIISSCDDTFRT